MGFLPLFFQLGVYTPPPPGTPPPLTPDELNRGYALLEQAAKQARERIIRQLLAEEDARLAQQNPDPPPPGATVKG